MTDFTSFLGFPNSIKSVWDPLQKSNMSCQLRCKIFTPQHKVADTALRLAQ